MKKEGTTIRVYHYAHITRRKSILKHGLIPMAYNGSIIKYGPRVFFTTEIDNNCRDFAGYLDVDIWEFDVDPNEMKLDEFTEEETYFYIERWVKPEDLRFYGTVD